MYLRHGDVRKIQVREQLRPLILSLPPVLSLIIFFCVFWWNPWYEGLTRTNIHNVKLLTLQAHFNIAPGQVAFVCLVAWEQQGCKTHHPMGGWSLDCLCKVYYGSTGICLVVWMLFVGWCVSPSMHQFLCVFFHCIAWCTYGYADWFLSYTTRTVLSSHPHWGGQKNSDGSKVEGLQYRTLWWNVYSVSHWTISSGYRFNRQHGLCPQ